MTGASGGREGGPHGAAVLFDLDGTLADTVDLILRCYRHTMRTHLGAELPDQRWLATLGTPLRDQLRDFARSADEARAMLETYERHQREIHDELVRPFDGAVETVRALEAAGSAVAVVTSKRREMARRTLEACGLAGFFEVVITASDVTAGKPDPEPVRKALAELEVAAGDGVVFVGDSPYDIRAGRSAGIRTAAALWGPFPRTELEAEGPDHLLESVAQVLEIGGSSGAGSRGSVGG